MEKVLLVTIRPRLLEQSESIQNLYLIHQTNGIGNRVQKMRPRCKIEEVESFYQRKTESTFREYSINVLIPTSKICEMKENRLLFLGLTGRSLLR